jgi:eukaryotic-like serine/threonine-protein kinase
MPLEASKKPLTAIGLYDLVEQVAEGGMGTVYRARHRETGDMVAVKVMTTNMTGNPVLLKRFEQEFHAARRLDHPNIVRALDFGQEAGVPYLVMEFVEGESLGQKIEREGRLSETEAIRLVAQVAQGLHRAHKMGLIHRDIKPDNVMVTPDGVAKLTDMGLVKEIDTDLNLTRTGRGLGTPHFMAPEQFRNAKNADLRCDIYALGATLYMMVTGELPFRSGGPLDAWMKKMHNDLLPPRKVVPSLSERIDWAIRRAMSADPEQRPTSCREFVEDLTGRSTRKLPSAGDSAASGELWYLVYKDEEGVTHTVKGSIGAIRRSLREGLLGDASNVRASRAKTGPFENLRSYPEFRDMVVTPAAMSVPKVPGAPDNSNGDMPTISQGIPPVNVSSRPSYPSGRTAPSPVLGDPQADDADDMPRIDLDGQEDPQNVEWLKWILLVLVSLVTAFVAFFLLQKLDSK